MEHYSNNGIVYIKHAINNTKYMVQYDNFFKDFTIRVSKNNNRFSLVVKNEITFYHYMLNATHLYYITSVDIFVILNMLDYVIKESLKYTSV